MSTLQTLRDKLRSEIKIDPNGRIWSDTVLNRNINSAVSRIQADGNYNWHFCDAENSESTVAAQSAYALPANFARVEEGTVTYDTQVMTPVSYKYVLSASLLDQSGTPMYYSLRGTNMYLVAVPDAIKTLKYGYRKKLTEMSSDATDSGLPSEFDYPVIKWAAYLSWAAIRDGEQKAVAVAQDYQELMKDLFAQYLGRRDESDFNMTFEVA